MAGTKVETPEVDYTVTHSALDFAYILIEGRTLTYPRNSATVEFQGSEDDEERFVEFLRYGAEEVGVELPTTYDQIKSWCIEEGEQISVTEAMHTRGAVMFKGRGLVVCVGDRKRIIHPEEDETVLRYASGLETADGFWDLIVRLPGMVYA